MSSAALFNRRFSIYSRPWDIENPALSRGFLTKQSSLYFYATRLPWSPSVFANGKRCKKNFLSADYLALDFDSGTEIGEMLSVFEDTRHICMTTKSHTDEHHRFRMIFPLEGCCEDLSDYEHTLRQLGTRYDCDSSCFEGARFFWPGKTVVSVVTEGYDLEIIQAPKQTEFSGENPYVGSRVIPPWARSTLEKPQPVGHRFHACWRIGKDLMRSGFSYQEAYSILSASKVAPGYSDDRYFHALDRAVAALKEETIVGKNPNGRTIQSPSRRHKPDETHRTP